MVSRLAVGAVGVAAVALGVGAGISAQTAVTTTSHPLLPRDPSLYWVIPEPSVSSSGERQTPATALTQLARGVALIADEDFTGGLSFVNNVALGATPLAQYARYYTGVALLGLGRADEAATTLAALDGRVEGYLQEALPLRMAEAALARDDPEGAVDILEQASGETLVAPEEVLVRLGAALEAAGDPEQARRIYQRVYDEFPISEQAAAAESAMAGLKAPPPALLDRVEDALARAERLFEARAWEEARAGFAPLLPLAMGDDRELVALRLAECDHYLNRSRVARDALEPYLRTASREAEARFFHLSATRALDQHDRYVTLARGLVADHPDSRWAEQTLNNLASHYIIEDDDEKADGVFRELVRRFPRGRYVDRAAWKIGWLAYKHDRFAEAAATFEAAAVVSPRANYRPSWLYWAARSRDRLGEGAAAVALYRVVAGDYLNSYYGRLVSKVLAARGEAPVRPIVVAGPVTGPVETAPAALVPTAPVIRALASVELYDQALQEVEYARRAWEDSSALQATEAWLRHNRALQAQALDRFADLRGAITLMRRAYPQFMAAGGEQIPPDVLRVIFPLEYWPLIKKYSDAHSLDPYLMTALVAQESTFAADVRSSADAVGLMQLIPSTARRYAAKLGIRYSSRILTQPETNIRLGMRYFKDLMNRFGAAHYALAGYNAGARPVARWIEERQGFEQDEFIDDIPFPETQNYVKRVLGTADDYRRLYEGGSLRTAPAARWSMGYNLGPAARAEPTHFWFQGFRAYIVPVVRAIAAGRRDLRMIDCGCGTGYNLKTLLQPHGRAFAFDMTPDALTRARVAGRPLVRADMEHIPFGSGTFDLVTSFDVVHSVADDRKALGEMARVLKPGGYVVMNVVALELLRGDHSEVWGEQRRYTRRRGARLVEDAGLEVVRVAYLFASLVPMILAVRTAQRMRRLFRAPSGDAELHVPPAPVNAILSGLVKAEAALARWLPMPFGSSLLVVARKP